MAKRVTVAVPVYKRLDLLPDTLRSVVQQDYPNLEILVSDNGGNGEALTELVERHCPRPHRIRRNARTVGLPEHFNQLIEEATGDYFLILSDDDEISSNYVSALVDALERHPEAGIALGRVERMDEAGAFVPRRLTPPPPPPLIPAPEFVRLWCTNSYDFVCFVTNLARTAEIRAVGGYPYFTRGNWNGLDNALVVKLTVGRHVAWVDDAVFNYRVYESSTGLSTPYSEMTAVAREFLRLLDTDPVLVAYARREPNTWRDMKALLVEMTWRTCRHRWSQMYRHRMSTPEWVRAAFTMPFIPGYYRSVSRTLFKAGLRGARRMLSGGRVAAS
jgi:glycosyltransferase involved in cell wall biosynthesis